DSWMNRRFEMLTLDGLDLSVAGRKPSTDPVHQHLADLHDGSTLRLEQFNDHLFLRDRNNYAVARLSKRGSEKWLPRIHQIEAVRVLAIIERKQTEGNASF